MTIQVLICHADGSQTLSQREVADNYFDEPLTAEGSAVSAKSEA